MQEGRRQEAEGRRKESLYSKLFNLSQLDSYFRHTALAIFYRLKIAEVQKNNYSKDEKWLERVKQPLKNYPLKNTVAKTTVTLRGLFAATFHLGLRPVALTTFNP